ncbi:MAG: carbon storage regulator CsrA [Marinobacterium sp.]|nr:carbon storage regulator CsrA [Marinobacterium sp.]
MLILTRYVGQTIVIGEDITVRVLRNYRGEVTLGIEAPKNVSVNREEVHQRISEAKKTVVASEAKGLVA